MSQKSARREAKSHAAHDHWMRERFFDWSGLSPRFIQHIASVAQDYQDDIFAGTNDLIETITEKPPLTLEEFVARKRARFAV